MSSKRTGLKKKLDCTQWSPGLTWIENEDLRAVVFFDENHNLAKKHTGNLKSGIVLLKFPSSFRGRNGKKGSLDAKSINSVKGPSDLEVVTSIISFIKNNPILVENKIKFALATVDTDFLEPSITIVRALRKSGIELKFLCVDRSKPGTKFYTTAKQTVDDINAFAYPDS